MSEAAAVVPEVSVRRQGGDRVDRIPWSRVTGDQVSEAAL